MVNDQNNSRMQRMTPLNHSFRLSLPNQLKRFIASTSRDSLDLLQASKYSGRFYHLPTCNVTLLEKESMRKVWSATASISWTMDIWIVWMNRQFLAMTECLETHSFHDLPSIQACYCEGKCKCKKPFLTTTEMRMRGRFSHLRSVHFISVRFILSINQILTAYVSQ